MNALRIQVFYTSGRCVMYPNKKHLNKRVEQVSKSTYPSWWLFLQKPIYLHTYYLHVFNLESETCQGFATEYLFGFSWKWRSRFAFSVFFPLHVNSKITWFYCEGDKKHCLCTVHESHNTIHTFKNYFVTMFSVFNFNNNKFNPNGP